ncbi:MAG: DNA translocase FtsK, partial [Bacteroidetes bacterium]
PPFELLEDHGGGRGREVNREELESNKNKILKTLQDYGINITNIKATIGPTVTLYEIVPAPGIRISKIKNLEDDIALSLAALGIRIIAPIPGKGTIGIEVPNSNPEVVSLRSVMTTEKFINTKAELPIAIGRTISNEVFIADLNKMPHLLIAGATGQGKSVGLNTVIASLLYKKHPAEVKFILIDPKKVELNLYQALKNHFLAQLPEQGDEPIVTDVRDAVNVLKSLCIEMDMRYDLLKRARVRNLREYNQKFVSRRLNPKKGHKFLPYIVLIIDELADMMMVAGKEVEMPIARLAQLARAVGIHLVVATQRPSVNVITGIIKANFPARMSYRVISKVDSRTILDANGADQLIGRGDLLLSTGSDLIRIQNAFIDTAEVERIVDYISKQRGFPKPYYLPELPVEGEEEGDEEEESFERDGKFEEAARLIVRYQIGSASLIQRKMKLGYNRAGRIIDQLERAKIVGPYSGSKAREVLVTDESELERYLNTLS